MSRFILLCLIGLIVAPLRAQMDTAYIPPQVMQLGHGTADALDWHPSGDVLAVGGQRGLWLYDERLADLAHFEEVGEITRLVWSPTGNLLATSGQDGILQIWEVTLEPYAVILYQSWTFSNTDAVYPALYHFAWSPDGEKLAVITSRGTHVLDVMTGKTLTSIPDLDYAVAWHPNGTQIAGVVNLGEKIGRQIRVWDAASGETINTYISPDSDFFWSDIQWNPDGSVLVGLTSIPAALHAWDIETGNLLNEVDTLYREAEASLDMWWLNDGRQLITLSRDVSPPATSILEIWDTESWTPVGRGIPLGYVQHMAKRPNTATWVLLTSDSRMMTWGLEEAKPLLSRDVHAQSPHILSWSVDSHYLATARHTGESFTVWDVTIPDQPEAHTAKIPYPHWDLDELRWNADNTRLIGIQSIHAFTAPGAYPIAFVVEWDTQTGDYLGVIHETPGYIAFDGSETYLPRHTWNSDFTRVATQTSDSPLTVSTVVKSENGDLGLDEEVVTIDAADYAVEITWSPDSTMLAGISRDRQGETSAWVYNAETGILVNRLKSSFSATLYDIIWSPDSSMVALASRRSITNNGEEHHLDILKIDPSSEEATPITTITDTDTTLYHTWHPESLAIAVSTASGVGIYPVQSTPGDVNITPISIIPEMNIFALAWSPDGTWLAGSHEDGTVRIWDVRDIST